MGSKRDVAVLECHPGEVDLFFVVDGSGSIEAANFRRALDFVNGLVQDMRIAHDGSQAASPPSFPTEDGRGMKTG